MINNLHLDQTTDEWYENCSFALVDDISIR